MPLCEFGSERRPDAPAYLVLDASYAASLLPPPVAWLIPYIPYLQPISLSLDDFCSIDPATVEIPTALELLALVARTPYLTAFAAGQKVASIVHYFAWYTFCRCSDGTPLPAPTNPSAPADLPVVNPPQYAPGGANSCRTDVINMAITRDTNYLGPYVAFPTGATQLRQTFLIDNPTYPVICGILPYSDTSDSSANAFTWRIDKEPFNGEINPSILATSSGPNYQIIPITHSTVYRAQFGANGSVGAYTDVPATATLTLEWFCGNDPTSPPGAYNPCIPCPPDPYLSGQLAQILGELAILKSQVDLIQRQAVPFATIDGDSHLGLTGEGEIEVFGLVGVRVGIVDSLAGTVGVTDGHPETLFNTGWIRWGDSAGWQERIFLDSEVTYSTPYAASGLTKIGYSLPPGMEIDIVEVRREA